MLSTRGFLIHVPKIRYYIKHSLTKFYFFVVSKLRQDMFT